MKPMNRLFCALLAAVLLIGACSAFAETAPAVFLPESMLRLKLPEKTSSFSEDIFRTGMEGAKSSVVYTPGKMTKVAATYPRGNYIRQIIAYYRNDAERTLSQYKIVYQVSDTEKYTITYAASTNTLGELHYNGKIIYHDKETYTVGDKEYHLTEEYASQTLVTDGVIYDKTKDKYYYNASLYLHHYTQDEILEGTYTNGDVTLKNGTGKYFGKNVWFLWDKDTGKVTRWRKGGTKPLTAFPSPRADEWFFE